MQFSRGLDFLHELFTAIKDMVYPNKVCKALALIRRLSVYDPGSNICIDLTDESGSNINIEDESLLLVGTESIYPTSDVLQHTDTDTVKDYILF